MQPAYRVYSRIAAGLFILITLYTVPTKLLQGRLEDDWLRSVLHLASASLGAYVGWSAAGVAPAKVFTWGSVCSTLPSVYTAGSRLASSSEHRSPSRSVSPRMCSISL